MFKFNTQDDLEGVIDGTITLKSNGGMCCEIYCKICFLCRDYHRIRITGSQPTCLSLKLDDVVNMANQFLELFEEPKATKINLTE